MIRSCILACLATMILISSIARSQDRILVDINSPFPSPQILTSPVTSANWLTATTNLRVALILAANSANPVDIWVAEGTYRPEGMGLGAPYTFTMSNMVKVVGGFQGSSRPGGGETMEIQRDPNIHVSVLSGTLMNMVQNSAYHVVTAASVNQGGELTGFTIRAGRANGPGPQGEIGGGLVVSGNTSSFVVSNCKFIDNWAKLRGGAVCIEDGSVMFVACDFEDNSASPAYQSMRPLNCNPHGGSGGAMAIDAAGEVAIQSGTFLRNTTCGVGGAIHFASTMSSTVPTIDNSSFLQNSSANDSGGAIATFRSLACTNIRFSGNFAQGSGGGIMSQGAFLTCSDCYLSNNTAIADGGGIYSNGGGVLLRGRHVSSFHSRFEFNSAGQGGGLYCVNSNPQLEFCEFFNNIALDSGAGIAHHGPNGFAHGIRFKGNVASNNGGAMYCAPTNTLFQISSCEFSDNQARVGSAIHADGGPNVDVDACTFFNNNATLLGGAVHSHNGSTATIGSSIFWHNTLGSSPGRLIEHASVSAGVLSISYSLIQLQIGQTLSTFGIPGSNNIGAYDDESGLVFNLPLFRRPGITDLFASSGISPLEIRDLRICPGSPCFNRGDPMTMGGFDISGQPRVADGRVDMGADENFSTFKGGPWGNLELRSEAISFCANNQVCNRRRTIDGLGEASNLGSDTLLVTVDSPSGTHWNEQYFLFLELNNTGTVSVNIHPDLQMNILGQFFYIPNPAVPLPYPSVLVPGGSTYAFNIPMVPSMTRLRFQAVSFHPTFLFTDAHEFLLN